MKYDIESSLREITGRGRRMRQKKKARTQALLSAAAVFTALLLGGAVYLFGRLVPVSADTSVYGSFLLKQEAGGYVLVGVICFAASSLLTYLALRRRNRSETTNRKDDTEEGES